MVLDALVYSLRESQKTVIHVVALFVKGATILCKVRLVANRFLTRCTPQYKLVGVLILLFTCQTSLANYLDYPAMRSFIERMAQKGFDRDYLIQTFSHVQRDENILLKAASPAEAKAWRSYRPIFLTNVRITAGVNFWNSHYRAIQAASQQYGIDPEYIVAIIGVETLYGRNTGKHNVLRSLTTLAMDFHKRSAFYTSELEHYFQLLREEGILNPAMLHGSYAGAMGLGQFISSSYREYAIDFNGDKRKDLWNPEDAIGSVANYFAHHGWQRGAGVTVPASINRKIPEEIISRDACKPAYTFSQLQAYGVQPIAKLNATHVGLLELFGPRGVEYWVIGDNFYVITRYNHSPKYAMAVFQLAQAIKYRKYLKQRY